MVQIGRAQGGDEHPPITGEKAESMEVGWFLPRGGRPEKRGNARDCGNFREIRERESGRVCLEGTDGTLATRTLCWANRRSADRRHSLSPAVPLAHLLVP